MSTFHFKFGKPTSDFAERIWTLFEEKRELEVNFDQCLIPPLNSRAMNQALTKVFFEGSLQKIQQMNPNFFQRLDQRKKIDQIAFSAFAKCEAYQEDYKLLKSGRPAQFNHASESITAMISKMSLSDWVIVFIHEVGHHFYQDEPWSRPFLDQKIIQRLENLAATKTSAAQLTPEETQLIDQWLWNGVHTKLIAEWKVWSLTLLYVESQPASVFGKNTAWLNYFHQLPVTIKYKELFKSLEANFTDPKEGLESKPVILERIQVLRQKLRQQVESGELQPLDFLGA